MSPLVHCRASRVACTVLCVLSVSCPVEGLSQDRKVLTSERLESLLPKYQERGYLRLDIPLTSYEGPRLDTLFVRMIWAATRARGGKGMSVEINPHTIRNDQINVFIIDQDPDGAFWQVKGNCAYTGYRNIILCDGQFLRRFAGWPETGDLSALIDTIAEGYAEQGFPGSREEVRRMTENVLSAQGASIFWILGHEIGHLVLGHKGRHFLFVEDEAADLIEYQAPSSQGYENAADGYVVSALKTGAEGQYLSVIMWLALTVVVHNDARRMLGERGIALTGSPFQLEEYDYDIVNRSETHPPFFARALLLAAKFAVDLGNDNSGHFGRIIGRTRVNGELLRP